ncbi:MAG: osmotically inducible protein OsmC [Pseudopedobacter saltans]|uniref:Osmotically inducible protein OsmC n=1 Tax=Pseudopedobacter saltans TaxID=151895 RepID=A0A2W5H0Z3_9SPHI|nr:MAG: osmotically inducible protein OsmC [Pseudopedobacter saltans]
MATIELNLVNGEYGFEAKDQSGHTTRMDTKPEMGGQNFGTRPMELLLEALAGCSSVDVVSILGKQKQKIDGLKVVVNGERKAQDDLSLWKDIEMVFQLKGDIDQAKAEKAVKLSIDKYCSVAATLVAAGAEITTKVEVSK